MLKVRETLCKTLLNKSNLADFTLNCYVGCSHGCLYCYARYMKKFKDRPEDWGYFVDVKVNAPEALAKQLKKIKPPKEVFMSSVGDGWQPLEAKYKLSRACLKILLEAGFEVDILTKSSLILRDFDLLEAYKTPSLGHDHYYIKSEAPEGLRTLCFRAFGPAEIPSKKLRKKALRLGCF